jgi:hypothetical protein
MVDDRVLPGSKEHQLPGSKVKGQKNIFYKNVEISIFTLKEGPIVDDRVRPGSTEHTSGLKGQKNIFHKNVEISIFTPKEGPLVDDRCLPGSKEHQLPGSKLKKTLIRKVDKTSRNHASSST